MAYWICKKYWTRTKWRRSGAQFLYYTEREIERKGRSRFHLRDIQVRERVSISWNSLFLLSIDLSNYLSAVFFSPFNSVSFHFFFFCFAFSCYCSKYFKAQHLSTMAEMTFEMFGEMKAFCSTENGCLGICRFAEWSLETSLCYILKMCRYSPFSQFTFMLKLALWIGLVFTRISRSISNFSLCKQYQSFYVTSLHCRNEL